MDSATIRSIKAKIAKLERLTTARGASVHEAATASRMAQQLRDRLPPEARTFDSASFDDNVKRAEENLRRARTKAESTQRRAYQEQGFNFEEFFRSAQGWREWSRNAEAEQRQANQKAEQFFDQQFIEKQAREAWARLKNPSPQAFAEFLKGLSKARAKAAPNPDPNIFGKIFKP
jgi:hypothetical protein